MKTSVKLFIGLFVCLFAGLVSCEQLNKTESGQGTAEFSFDLKSEQDAKSSSDSSSVPSGIMISVENMAGIPVFTDKVIPLYTFGTEYVSKNIELATGQYRLTKFMVINTAGKVLFAAPVAGSPMAYLTTRPLPLTFNIMTNHVTKVMPEVLQVGNLNPDQFGYAAFGFQVINPLAFWVVCLLDNPLAESPVQLTFANLTVISPSGWRFTFRLQASPNNITIRGGADFYDLLVEKEGFEPQKFHISAEELKSTTQDKPLVLKIPSSAGYKVLSLQPGPEKGKDALVSNLEPDKNFGGHKYFEATFLSEPLLTVMRSNRSLIKFNLDSLPESAVLKKIILTLSYDFPVPYDISIFKPDIYPSPGIDWYGGVLQQIVEQWEEDKVTWNSQPKTTDINQVFIPPFNRNINFINIDVTRLFLPPATTSDGTEIPNHGMLFRLWPADKFPGFRFASSDFPEPNMRPKLTIYYTF